MLKGHCNRNVVKKETRTLGKDMKSGDHVLLLNTNLAFAGFASLSVAFDGKVLTESGSFLSEVAFAGFSEKSFQGVNVGFLGM